MEQRGKISFLIFPSLMIMLMDKNPPWSSKRNTSYDVVSAEQGGKLINLIRIILLSDTFYQTTVYNKNLNKTIFDSE